MKLSSKAAKTSIDASLEPAGKSQLGRLIAPVIPRLYVACGLQAVSAVAGVVPFIAVAELGKALLSDGAVNQAQIWWIGAIAVLAMALRLVFSMAASAMTHLADLDLQLHLRQQMATRLSNVPLGWFDAHSAGEVKKALQEDITALHHIVGHSYTNMISAIVTPIIALGYLLWTDWRLTLAAILPMLIGIVLYAVQFRGYGEKMAKYNRALADVNAASVEFVQGIAVIKTFGQTQKAYGRFIKRAQAFIDYFWNWVRGLITISAMAEVALSPLFSLTVVLVAGLLLVGVGLAEPISVLPFVVFAPGLTAPFMTLAVSQNDSVLAKEAAKRIIALLDTPTLPIPKTSVSPQGARVVFDGVSFSYDRENDALKAIDMVLEPGTVTALVGPSGSGKSTLARLLPRFYDVSAG
ncbi:MAG: ABC transporter ATP-binding protein, partial [Pseudomonadota bacterium]